MTNATSDRKFVSVSNGTEFMLIPRSELTEATSNGYYRPLDRGLTIIEKDGRLYEVTLEQSETASTNGYKDLLTRERRSSHLSNQAAVGEACPPLPIPVPLPTPIQADSNSVSLLTALHQSERAAEAARQEQERLVAEQNGWRQTWLRLCFWFAASRAQLLRQLGTNGISLAIHLAVILLLGSFYLVNQPPKDLFIVSSMNSDDNLVEEFTIAPEPIEVTEPTQNEEAESSPIEDILPEVTEQVELPNFMALVSGDAIKPPAAPAKPAEIPGNGLASAKGKPTFFGSKLSGINYVFVIDNSNSMTRGRFETALLQLMLTVNQLTPKQRFYVIFYSDTAYGMMHPKAVSNLVPATTQNKRLLANWLDTVPLCLRTNGKQAIATALKLKPDAIYVLGDGAFTDRAADYFSSNPTPNVVIHTRGMEVKPSDAEGFKRLATTHRGTYMDVGVMPEGAAMAKQYPRPRNNTRGPVWGIELPIK